MVINNVLIKKKHANFILGLVYLIPVLLVFWFMNAFYVNVPYWDEWSLVPFFETIANGSVNFEDFFTQHNEHRILFPRIIFAALSFASNLNLYLHIFFSLFIVVITFLSIHKLTVIDRIKGEKKFLYILFNVLSCFLLFSLIQYENWLWGFQVAWFLINACVVISVLIIVAARNLSANIRLLLSGLCCIVASFSSAHGLLSWLALIPSVLSLEGNTNRRIARLGVWITLFMVCFVIYTYGYQKPGHHPDTLFFLKNPLISGRYLLTIIGYPLGKTLFLSQAIGFLILLSFLFFNLYCLKNYKSKLTLHAIPWLSIGWFAALFAAMTTVGRSGFGVEQAMASRYTSVLILLSVSILQLYRLFLSHHHIENTKNNKLYSRIIPIFLISIFVTFFLSTNIHAISEAKQISVSRRFGKTCLELVEFLDKSIDNASNNCINYIYPNTEHLKDYANKLEEIGFREFPENIVFQEQTLETHGYIDITGKTKSIMELYKSDTLQMAGWAILPKRTQQPKLVFISYDDEHSFFAYAIIKLDRPDVEKALKSSLYRKSGWETSVPLKNIPLGEHTIHAWVYGRELKKFIKLNNEINVKIS